MTATRDKYYQIDNLFGDPYPELLTFFSEFHKKGKVLEFGCGQGRDAIALARIGYSVTRLDNSKGSIDQLNQIGKTHPTAEASDFSRWRIFQKPY